MPIVVVGVWIYFFALILVLGAEAVAFGALADARAAGQSVGPAPDGTVPQRISMANEEPAANRPPANEIAAWRHALSPRSRARATTSSGRPTLAG